VDVSMQVMIDPAGDGSTVEYGMTSDYVFSDWGAPITIIASTSQLLVTNPSFRARNVRELIALCKANPGQVNYGSSGTGGSLHLAMELFRSMTGIDIVHVPYKGGPPAATDLIAGQIELLFFNTPAALPYIKAAKLRALGVSTAKRSALLPDVPTIAEAGVPGFDTDVWFGLVAPAGTPSDVIVKTHRDIARVVGLPEVRKQLLDIGADPVANTPQEFALRIKKIIEIAFVIMALVTPKRVAPALSSAVMLIFIPVFSQGIIFFSLLRITQYFIRFINELEFIDGYIYANRYQTNDILKIDPANGHVVGKMDLTGLLAQYDATEIKNNTDVLNGIAYDSATKKLYITGKRWPKMFQVHLNQ